MSQALSEEQLNIAQQYIEDFTLGQVAGLMAAMRIVPTVFKEHMAKIKK